MINVANIKRDNDNQAFFRADELIPYMINGILDHDLLFDKHAENILHSVISNFDPDMALLCCANIGKIIYEFESSTDCDFSFMIDFCERLIAYYRPICALEESNPCEREVRLISALAQIIEDIEDLCDNLEMTKIALDMYSPESSEIIGIMLVHLQSHLLIVEQLLEQRQSNYSFARPAAEENGGDDYLIEEITNLQVKDNIIPFPCMNMNKA